MTDQEIKQKADAIFESMEANRIALETLQKECPHTERYEGFYSWRPGAIDPAFFCTHCRKMLELSYKKIQ